jgi:hypothetical protein
MSFPAHSHSGGLPVALTVAPPSYLPFQGLGTFTCFRLRADRTSCGGWTANARKWALSPECAGLKHLQSVSVRCPAFDLCWICSSMAIVPSCHEKCTVLMSTSRMANRRLEVALLAAHLLSIVLFDETKEGEDMHCLCFRTVRRDFPF